MADETTTAETATEETETTTETESEQATVAADARLPDDHPVMKTMQAERDARKKLEKQLADRQSADDAAAREAMDEHERAIAEARDAGKAEASATYQAERLADKVRIAAARQLNDPEDAVRLLDLSGLDPASTDLAAEIAAALDALVESKPYLAHSETPPAGSSDARSRSDERQSDVTKMTPAQVREWAKANR